MLNWCLQVLGASQDRLLPRPPAFPDFKKIFKGTLALKNDYFDALREENTEVQNCKCHRLLFSNWTVFQDSVYTRNTTIADDTCVVTTVPPPTTVVTTLQPTTTVVGTTQPPPTTRAPITSRRPSTTTSEQEIRPHPGSPTTAADTRQLSTQPSTAAVPMPDRVGSSPDTTILPPPSTTTGKGKNAIPVTDKKDSGIKEGTAIIIGISAGIIAMIFIAAIFAVCRYIHTRHGWSQVLAMSLSLFITASNHATHTFVCQLRVKSSCVGMKSRFQCKSW